MYVTFATQLTSLLLPAIQLGADGACSCAQKKTTCRCPLFLSYLPSARFPADVSVSSVDMGTALSPVSLLLWHLSSLLALGASPSFCLVSRSPISNLPLGCFSRHPAALNVFDAESLFTKVGCKSAAYPSFYLSPSSRMTYTSQAHDENGACIRSAMLSLILSPAPST